LSGGILALQPIRCVARSMSGSRLALQSFRLRCSPRGVAATKASSRNSLLVQSFKPVEVPPLLVLRSHFAVGHFLGCVVFLRRVALNTLSSQCVLSSSFAFLQSLAQRNLARRSQPADTSHGLSFPSAQRVRRSTCTGSAAARYVPPPGFGYPLGGLRPPSPCRFSFTPAALLGFTLRSFLLPEGIRRVSAGKDPRTVPPAGIPAAETVGRPNGLRFLGFDPSGSPWRPEHD
jgi:hypothetical protein